jgi:glucose 1-dehydrogenase
MNDRVAGIAGRGQDGAEQPNIPWHRRASQEAARLALYLASGDADYITGQSFTIDGGLEMNWSQGA